METEVKFKVPDHGPIRARLEQAGATPLGKVLEVNHIFDDAARTLVASQRGLRVRTNHAGDGQLISALMTYKGPPLSLEPKQREEIETEVSRPDDLIRLLRALGFINVITFEKRRESWRLDEAHIELDELPQLGRFLEIEASDSSELERIEPIVADESAVPVHDTYVALVANFCPPASDGTRKLTF